MRPSQLLWAVVGLNAMLWTILPWAVATSPALDVVEGIIWGQEWQWGYYKHPPLPSTFLYLIWLVLPGWAPFIASQICIAATLYFVYRLGQSTIGEERAVVGCLLLFGLYHFTFPTPQFNHNVAQMPLWAAAYYFGWRSCEGGRLRDWALTGLVVVPVPVPAEPSAEQLREQAKAARKTAVEIIKVNTTAGNTFYGDETSQTRMSRAILVLSTGYAPTVPWVLADNTVIQADVAELTEALARAGQAQAALWVIE
jgi:hypothetical protein